MKALTLTQPWATLVARGEKTYETRSWQTTYRGEIAIHAAKGWTRADRDFARSLGSKRNSAPSPLGIIYYEVEALLPRGAIIAVATIAECWQMDAFIDVDNISEEERAYGDFRPGRWAWKLEHVRALPMPVPCRGALWLWTVPQDVEARVNAERRAKEEA